MYPVEYMNTCFYKIDYCFPVENLRTFNKFTFTMPSTYILSTHPVWVIFDEMGLPPEIINIIFSYNTYFSPFKHVGKEIRDCQFHYMLYLYDSLFERSITLQLISISLFTDHDLYFKIIKGLISDYILTYRVFYNKNNLEIYYKFIKYYENWLMAVGTQEFSLLLNLDNNIKDMVGSLLQKVMYKEYLVFINKIIEKQNKV